MTLRSPTNTNHVPDSLYALFVAGAIDHFEFAGNESVAVYDDGHRETFDATVTQAMLDGELEKSTAAHFEDSSVKILGHELAILHEMNLIYMIIGEARK